MVSRLLERLTELRMQNQAYSLMTAGSIFALKVRLGTIGCFAITIQANMAKLSIFSANIRRLA